MKNKIIRWFNFLFWYPSFKLISFLCQKQRVFLFGTGTGYFHDNPKYLFLEFLKNNHKSYWVAKNNKTYNLLKNLNLPVLRKNTLKGVYYSAISHAYIVSAEVFDVAYFINPHTKLVQLWHGTPIKKIGLDNNLDRKNNFIKSRFLGKSYTYERFDLLFVDEEKYINIFHSAFGLDKSKIKPFGQIRNIIFKNNKCKELIKKNLSLNSYDKIILYTPTYRPCVKQNIDLLNQFIADLDLKKLTDKNFIVLIKLHPFLTNGMINLPAEIITHNKIINVSHHYDTQELLLVSDILITDISSSALDFIYSNKPIIRFFPDEDQYIESRNGVYSTYHDIINLSYKMSELFSIKNKQNNIASSIKIRKIINSVIN